VSGCGVYVSWNYSCSFHYRCIEVNTAEFFLLRDPIFPKVGINILMLVMTLTAGHIETIVDLRCLWNSSNG
jgi:hypothetical protein